MTIYDEVLILSIARHSKQETKLNDTGSCCAGSRDELQDIFALT
jgi:hypothetical protein